MTWLRVEVIRADCAGYANCLDVAPDVFDLDEHDIAVVAEQVYSADRRALLEDAAHRCPAKAIVVTELE
ncbi:MAG: ferredoxin [Acidimicrobiales bacterium]|jgi:ferredoxin